MLRVKKKVFQGFQLFFFAFLHHMYMNANVEKRIVSFFCPIDRKWFWVNVIENLSKVNIGRVGPFAVEVLITPSSRWCFASLSDRSIFFVTLPLYTLSPQTANRQQITSQLLNCILAENVNSLPINIDKSQEKFEDLLKISLFFQCQWVRPLFVTHTHCVFKNR